MRVYKLSFISKEDEYCLGIYSAPEIAYIAMMEDHQRRYGIPYPIENNPFQKDTWEYENHHNKICYEILVYTLDVRHNEHGEIY